MALRICCSSEFEPIKFPMLVLQSRRLTPLFPSTHVAHKRGGHAIRGSRDALRCAQTTPVRKDGRIVDTSTLADTRRTNTQRCAWQLNERHPYTSHRPPSENGRPHSMPHGLPHGLPQRETDCTRWGPLDHSCPVKDLVRWDRTTDTQQPSHHNHWSALKGGTHVPRPTHAHPHTRNEQRDGRVLSPLCPVDTGSA